MVKGRVSSTRYSFKGITMRSSWEVNVARLMSFENIKFIYEPQRFDLSDKISYLPDFYLPETKVYLEVKGKLRTNDIKKMKEFVRQGYYLFLLRWEEYNKLIKGRLSMKEFLGSDRFTVS